MNNILLIISETFKNKDLLSKVVGIIKANNSYNVIRNNCLIIPTSHLVLAIAELCNINSMEGAMQLSVINSACCNKYSFAAITL